MKSIIVSCACMSILVLAYASAGAVPEKYRPAVKKGLDWLVKQQHKDGHWEGKQGKDAVLLTSIACLALLQEGSTVVDGLYALNVDKTVDWLLKRCQPDGRIGPKPKMETADTLIEHAFAMRVLAAAYGYEPRRAQRDLVKDKLIRAVHFALQTQSSQGGWSHKKDRTDLDVTFALMHGLRQARNAGIFVPKEMLKKGYDRIKSSTLPSGAVAERVNKAGQPKGGDSVEHTIAALAAYFAKGEFTDEACKKWLKYLASEKIALDAMDPLDRLALAEALFRIGDGGFARLLPDARRDERFTWTSHRAQHFDRLLKLQDADGSWPRVDGRGPIFATAVNLIILQQDNEPLPLSR